MRRKKLLRQVAAAAVALSMAVSLSAPAFAATFDLSNGGLVITADDSGITVKRDDGTRRRPRRQRTPPLLRKSRSRRIPKLRLTLSRIPRPKIRITTATLLTRKRRSRMPLQTGS